VCAYLLFCRGGAAHLTRNRGAVLNCFSAGDLYLLSLVYPRNHSLAFLVYPEFIPESTPLTRSRGMLAHLLWSLPPIDFEDYPTDTIIYDQYSALGLLFTGQHIDIFTPSIQGAPSPGGLMSFQHIQGKTLLLLVTGKEQHF